MNKPLSLRAATCLLIVFSFIGPFCFRVVQANVRVREPRKEVLAIDSKALESWLNALFAEEMKKQHLPGIAFVLVKDGRVVLSKGYGWANVEQQIPVTPERTVFRIGSITKVFTAMALMQLVDRKKITLQDDVFSLIEAAEVVPSHRYNFWLGRS